MAEAANPLAVGGEATRRIVVMDDIRYRPGGSEAWRLDLAMLEADAGAPLRPALVIVHGGGWGAGSKRDRPYRSMLLDYALKGYVTLSVDYRLTSEAPLPACIEDVKCAIRWLKAHAGQFGVDPGRIGVYGHSAGAHLALMIGLCRADAGLEGDGGWDEHTSEVAAVAGGSPPTFLPPRFGDPVRHAPITYLHADAPPILLIQGTADFIVPAESTDKFVDQARELGLDVTYERIDDGNHGVAYDNFLDRSTAALDAFFRRTLR